MKYRYNAAGTDVIPNKKFWMEFPLLIKVKHYNIIYDTIIKKRNIIEFIAAYRMVAYSRLAQ